MILIVELTEGDGTRPVLFKADRWEVISSRIDARPSPADGMLQLYSGDVIVGQFLLGAYAGVYRQDALA